MFRQIKGLVFIIINQQEMSAVTRCLNASLCICHSCLNIIEKTKSDKTSKYRHFSYQRRFILPRDPISNEHSRQIIGCCSNLVPRVSHLLAWGERGCKMRDPGNEVAVVRLLFGQQRCRHDRGVCLRNHLP